jgi:hypothetical protein
VNEFTDYLHTPFRTTKIYNPVANLHNPQITTAPAKSFPAFFVFTSNSLTTTSNTEDSSASRAQILSKKPPMQNCLNSFFQLSWL